MAKVEEVVTTVQAAPKLTMIQEVEELMTLTATNCSYFFRSDFSENIIGFCANSSSIL